MFLIAFIVGAVAIALVLFFDNRIHRSDVQSLEDEVIFSLYGDNVRSAWKTLQVQTLHGISEQWNTHYIESTRYSSDKPDVLLLHGYGATSAFTWRVTIPALVDKFNVFAIDMPGFGRTEAPESLLVRLQYYQPY